jgi:hypothetical protein
MSASIASSRKGRPNQAKDSDYLDITADFEMTIRNWRLAERLDFEPDEFELEIRCLAGDVEEEPIGLNQFFIVDSRIRRGPVPVYKFALISANRGLVLSRLIAVDDEEGPADLLSCKDATQEEIDEALAYVPEPEPEPQPVAPAPTFTRIPRTNGDSASYLGFEFGGRDERSIRLPQCWQALGFHLASPQIIGAVSAVPGLQLKLFDAWGNLLLESFQSMETVRFDQQRRLESGDYLLAFYGPGREARGTYVHPNARLLADEPTKPSLDDILWGPGERVCGQQLAVPVFRFGA